MEIRILNVALGDEHCEEQMVSNEDREKFMFLLEKVVRLEGRAAHTYKVTDSERAVKARMALAKHVLGTLNVDETTWIKEME